MADAFLSNVLRENRDLFALIYRFNCQPARDICPDHLAETVSPALLKRLRNSRRGERKLSQWIITRWELAESGIWDFSDSRRRLALLESPDLSRLIRLAGAAVSSRRIAQVIDRAGQNRLLSALGEDLYLFAVKRAPFLAGDLPENAEFSPDADPASQVRTAGLGCLSTCLSDQPRELLNRLALKLPPDLSIQNDAPATDEERNRIWKPIKRILLSEFNALIPSCFN